VIPGKAVDREHPGGPAPFEFEREEAVIGADIEDRLAGEVGGNPQQAQAAPKSPVHARRPGDHAAEIERGIEVGKQRPDPGLQLAGLNRGQIALFTWRKRCARF